MSKTNSELTKIDEKRTKEHISDIAKIDLDKFALVKMNSFTGKSRYGVEFNKELDIDNIVKSLSSLFDVKKLSRTVFSIIRKDK